MNNTGFEEMVFIGVTRSFYLAEPVGCNGGRYKRKARHRNEFAEEEVLYILRQTWSRCSGGFH
jgi:hypothetical protein